METHADELRALLDRDAIRQCIIRVARGEDRRDAAILQACWWPDAIGDYGVFRGNFDEYLAWIVPGAAAVALTQHVLGQSLIEVQGENARAETLVASYHRIEFGGPPRDVCIGGRYLDVFARRGGEWRIARRTMLYDWSQDWGVSADWTKGLMGTPLSAAHFVGRTRGDHSEAFFGTGSR